MNIAQLFPAYKRLQRDLNETLSDKMRLQDQLVSLQADNAWIRAQMQSAIDYEREARKMMTNVAYQSTYGMKPYPESPGLPERLTTTDNAPPKHDSHWLRQRQDGMAQSQATLDTWMQNWGAHLAQAKQALYGPEAPKDGDKLAQPEEMVLGE